jgi:hypothetical protein
MGRSSFVWVALLAAPLCVAAQEDSRLPPSGRYGLSVTVPEGGGAGIGLAAGGEYADGPEGSWRAMGLLEAGVGAEWFPVSGVSLSASTGIRATYGQNSGQGWSTETASVNAFRSSLLLNLYF